jgi:phage baseplate assembly protein W
LRIAGRGGAATSTDNSHVREMIEQLLFTSAGERVNRPDFGTGLRQLVFAPNSPELATAVEFNLEASLQQWLGDVIDVTGLSVVSEDASVRVAVEYIVRTTGEAGRAVLTQPEAS